MVGWLLALTIAFVIYTAYLKVKIKLLNEEVDELRNFKIVIYDTSDNVRKKRKGGLDYVAGNTGSYTGNYNLSSRG